MKDPTDRKIDIEKRIEELRNRLEQIETSLDETPDPDLADQAIELEDDEVLEALGRAGQLELRQLEDALARISKGTFGVCAKCGDEISDARLDAVPFATLCRTCANPATP